MDLFLLAVTVLGMVFLYLVPPLSALDGLAALTLFRESGGRTLGRRSRTHRVGVDVERVPAYAPMVRHAGDARAALADHGPAVHNDDRRLGAKMVAGDCGAWKSKRSNRPERID